MSGSFPTSPAARSVKVSSFTPTLISVTHSLKRQVRRRGGQQWTLEVEFPPMTRDEFAPIYAFVVSQRGQYETFTYTPPLIGVARGAMGGTPLVNAVHAVGVTSIATDGWPNSTLVLKAGDFVKFAGHNKVYLVTANATTDGTGAVTLTIEPPLNTALANNEAITVNGVPFTVALVSDVQAFGLEMGPIYSFSLNMVEVV
jgi:hypothetical protein